MKKAIITIALMPLSAFAGTFTLDEGPYWQVQDSVTYLTACEGRITACDAPDGIYHIINLDTGERRENVPVLSAVVPTIKDIRTYEDTQTGYSGMAFGCDMGSLLAVACSAKTSNGLILPHSLSFSSSQYGDLASCSTNEPATITVSYNCQY